MKAPYPGKSSAETDFQQIKSVVCSQAKVVKFYLSRKSPKGRLKKVQDNL